MHKLLLMSILFAVAIIPAIAAREPGAEQGLRKTLRGILIFNFVYMLAVSLIYTHIAW